MELDAKLVLSNKIVDELKCENESLKMHDKCLIAEPIVKNDENICCNHVVVPDCLKSKFWKIGFKTCVLEEHFISYSCIFISYIQCFEVSIQISGYFSKKLFFQNFNWSNLIFNQSKSCLKNSESLCLVRLVEPIFRSIEHHDSSF